MLKIESGSTGPELDTLPPKIKRAAQKALRGVALDVRDAIVGDMASRFDRPKQFTMRAFRVDVAGDEAVVWAMPIQARYLLQQIEGGERETKPFEHRMRLFGGQVALPDRSTRLDAYGNIPMAAIRKTGGQGGRFFTGAPDHMPGMEGVWERVGKRGLRRVMRFADEADYIERLDLQAVAERTVGLRWESQLLRHMQAA